jgi:diguanylate cyclase (GGDEF)-like protein
VRDTERDRSREMARSTCVLFAAASLITAAGLALPHARQVDVGGLLVVIVVAGAVALGMAWRGAAVPARAYPAIAVVGTALVSLGLFFNGERHGGPVGSDEMYYLWVTLWAAYYFTRRALAAQVVIILGAYALTLVLIHPGDAGTSRWVSLGGLVVGAAVVVRMLSERNERLVSELRTAALTDPLTGLANRRGLEGAFVREAAREARTGRPFALLVLDLDQFKRLNDERGHKAGDRALAEVAEILRSHAREVDTAARTGGDEFALVLSDTGADGARALLARLAAAIGKHGHDAGWPGGVSIGWSVSDADGAGMDALMRHADMRLYAAKREHHAGVPDPPVLRRAG